MPILITENLHPGCLIAQLAGSCGLQIIFQLHVHSAIPIGLSTQRVPHDLLWAKTGWHIMKTTVGLDSEDLRLATSTGIYQQNELGQAHWEACFHSIYPSQKAIALRKYNVFESVWWHGLFIFSWDSTGTINHSISLYPSSLSSEVGSWTRFSQLGCLSFFFFPLPSSHWCVQDGEIHWGSLFQNYLWSLKCSISALSNMVTTRQVWLLRNWNVTWTSATEKLNLKWNLNLK